MWTSILFGGSIVGVLLAGSILLFWKTSQKQISSSFQKGRPFLFAFLLASLALSLSAGFLSLPSKVLAAENDPVYNTVNYAVDHWSWSIYNNTQPVVVAGAPQDNFQCAEFVARAVSAAGSIGGLTPSSPGFDRLEYPASSGTFYNLRLVSEVYRLLVTDTHVGTDVGTSLTVQNLTIGSLVIFGTNTGNGINDFSHVAIVTKTDGVNLSSIMLSQHNNAEQYFPESWLTSFHNDQGLPEVITHIVQLDYTGIANGALSQGTILPNAVKMIAPAPYSNRIISSGITLSWKTVSGAGGYEVAVYDVNGNLKFGESIGTTSFTFALSSVPHGSYSYTIQPVGNASFPPFADTFRYEPNTCVQVANSANVNTTSKSCAGFASGVPPKLPLPPTAIVKVSTSTGQNGCTTNVFTANDDGSTGAIGLPFTLNFFGTSYSSVYVNNNGNVTFDGPLSDYTPYSFSSTPHAIIGPYFADVDTRGQFSGQSTYGNGTYNGHAAFCVNWLDVGYFNSHTDRLNGFQLVLIDRSDIAAGDFDIMMNYKKLQWETGDASGGNDGLGGTSAYVGYSNGSTAYFELSGSGINGTFLDSNPTGLTWTSLNSSQAGRYILQVRNTGTSSPAPKRPTPTASPIQKPKK